MNEWKHVFYPGMVRVNKYGLTVQSELRQSNFVTEIIEMRYEHIVDGVYITAKKQNEQYNWLFEWMFIVQAIALLCQRTNTEIKKNLLPNSSSDNCYVDENNGNQKIYDHDEIVETGKCNLTRCINGSIEEEFRFPYMVYCENTNPASSCQVILMVFVPFLYYEYDMDSPNCYQTKSSWQIYITMNPWLMKRGSEVMKRGSEVLIVTDPKILL